MKRIILYAIAVLSILKMDAQNFSDALRYSQFDPVGTARFTGTGSALGPLGADFSTITTNPAGLAWMRQSEFVITPSLYNNTTDSKLVNGGQNATYLDRAVNFSIPNFGLVIASRASRNWSTFNFAIGLNRLADFNQQFFYDGDSRGSIMNRFEEVANSTGLDDFEAGLAYDADALLEDNGFFFSDFTDYPDAVINRQQYIDRSGSLSEVSFGFAGNYQEKVLWGLAIGIPFLNYRETKEYNEADISDEVPIFDDLTYRENLTATGGGVNLKLGVIIRLHQALRLGFSIHTPTFYEINEIYSSDLTYNYTFDNANSTGEAFSPEGNFTYNLTTPWRFSGGAGFLFGKNGFLTGEVEYVDYTSNNFGFTDFPEDERIVNESNRDNLSSALKVRLGAEYVYDIFRIRGGVGLQQAPIVGDNNFYNTYSFGAGFRQNKFFMDFAYKRQNVKDTYTPYLSYDTSQQFVNNDVGNNLIVVTLGFKL